MHRTHLRLLKWFLAIFIISSNINGISAKQLQKRIAVSYPTAWYLLHRIREAMKDPLSMLPLNGIIQTAAVPFNKVMNNTPWRKLGRAYEPIVAAGLEESQTSITNPNIISGGRMVMTVLDPSRGRDLDEFIVRNVAPGTTIIHPERLQPNAVPEDRPRTILRSKSIDHQIHQVKQWLKGIFRGMVGKHLQRYLNEFAYRFNHRLEPETIFHRIIHLVIHGRPFPYRRLIDDQNWSGQATGLDLCAFSEHVRQPVC